MTDVGGCGGVTVRYYLWERGKIEALFQWNRIVNSGNEVTLHWNAFVDISNTVLDYDTAIGSVPLRDAASAVVNAVDSQRFVMQEETNGGQFSALASAELAAFEVFAEVARLTIAAVDGDLDAWNSSIDVWATVDGVIATAETESATGCDFWESLAE